MATLTIVSTGPGGEMHLTGAAREALNSADIIIGYDTYIQQIRNLLPEKAEVISNGMTQEVERCREAIQRARSGSSVALVSGGDSGIYGMAGLVLELLHKEIETGERTQPPPEIRVLPGVSAIQAAASVLGAPLMHDFAVISLSDLMTSWEIIERRLAAASESDFVIALYNPRSKGRVKQLDEACRIIGTFRPQDTPVGIVRNACREGQHAVVTTLYNLPGHDVDMSSIVLIGNSTTFVDHSGRMVTPRGYCTPVPPPPDEPQPVSAEPEGKSASVMFCGTASDVGKSVITAGFCRYLVKQGVSVAPFKSQNMSLNSFVTPEGGEISRAQAVQAQACDINPHTDMNPILLKPSSDTGSQVIVQGKVVGTMSIAEYDDYKPAVFSRVQESYARLKDAYEFIVIEGAGSIAEINLKHNDIVNMKIAEMADSPVILVADIDRGGVFAQIVGTIQLLDPHERRRLKGIIINKFRGDRDILMPGIEQVQAITGIPVLGILPWLNDLALPAEDSVVLGNRSKVISLITSQKRIHVGVIKLPRISNYTDFDPLQSEPDIVLHYVEVSEQLEGLDMLIIPGSKSTIADLYFLMERGMYDTIREFKGYIMGICGGFQMLGHRVLDPAGVESSVKEAEGLGLLNVETEILLEKETHQALAYLEEAGLVVTPDCNGVMTGYEIHMGKTVHTKLSRPFARIFRRGETSVNVEDGSVSPDGRIFGTYLHGLFENARFREIFINRIRLGKGMPLRRGVMGKTQQDPFDMLVEQMEKHLNLPALRSICGLDR